MSEKVSSFVDNQIKEQGKKYVVYLPVSRGGLSPGAIVQQGLEKVIKETIGEDNFLCSPLQAESYKGEGLQEKIEKIWGLDECVKYVDELVQKTDLKKEEILWVVPDDVTDTNSTGKFIETKLHSNGYQYQDMLFSFIFGKLAKAEREGLEFNKQTNQIIMYDIPPEFWIVFYHELSEVSHREKNSMERKNSIRAKHPYISQVVYDEVLDDVRKNIQEIEHRSHLRLYLEQILDARKVFEDEIKTGSSQRPAAFLTLYNHNQPIPYSLAAQELWRFMDKEEEIGYHPYHGVVSFDQNDLPYIVGGEEFFTADNNVKGIAWKIQDQMNKLLKRNETIQEKGIDISQPMRVVLMGMESEKDQIMSAYNGLRDWVRDIEGPKGEKFKLETYFCPDPAL
ncbi:MAG: hypothetical protein KKF44_10985 [Nanoarchaeota archaeon]|nr:hypothetical protein [Nanoarchaeota archaeon]